MAFSIEDMARQMSQTQAPKKTKPAASAQTPAPAATTAPPSDVLSVSLDLGGDTLKIAFAYAKDGETQYGKMTLPDSLAQIAVPAMAYYDATKGEWLYGDQIDQSGCEDFITIVKIKTLISLLAMPERPKIVPNADGSPISDAKKRAVQKEWEAKKKVWESNIEHYQKKHHFPKFYFPVRHASLDEFAKMVAEDMTFEAKGFTPHKVCEAFFAYVCKLVKDRRTALEKKLKQKFSELRICLVRPAKVGEEYLAEYSRLVEKNFKVKPFRTVSTNRALAMYAMHRGAVSEGESFLVFDMGEESISVVGASVLGGQVAIDGVDGHSLPKDIGGNNVDEAIVRYLEATIDGRETIGTPAFGEEGHIREESVFSKQYLLMRGVKRAKVIFSKPLAEDSVFKSGVPITFSREVFVQRRLTKKEITKSIGIDDKCGIAAEVVQYILDEAKLPINRKVTKIFVSGGLLETYGLLDYIKSELKAVGSKLTVCTFDDGRQTGDEFSILSFEDSVFAAAVGGSIVALHNIEIKTVLSLSYGTWAGTLSDPTLALFANRGDPIAPEGSTFLTGVMTVKGAGVTEGEEYFSAIVSREDISAARRTKKWNFSEKGSLRIGKPKSDLRRAAVRDVGLARVAGGEKAKTFIKHNGRFVFLGNEPDGTAAGLPIQQGFFVDHEGRARPIVLNAVKSSNAGDKRVTAYYYDSLSDQTPKGGAFKVLLSELEPGMSGVDDIYTN